MLCSFGYRREPMGVRAVLSHDGGVTWDMDNVIVLRDDGGTPSEFRSDAQGGGADVGYPISTQLSDGSILDHLLHYVVGWRNALGGDTLGGLIDENGKARKSRLVEDA